MGKTPTKTPESTENKDPEGVQTKTMKAFDKELLSNLKGEEVKTTYLSFLGNVEVPSEEQIRDLGVEEKITEDSKHEIDYYESNGDTKNNHYYYCKDNKVAYINGKEAKYYVINKKDSLTVYLAFLGNGIGHIRLDCPMGNWIETSFVLLDESGNVKMAEKKLIFNHY